MTLQACSSCRRHVRSTTCPFCGAAVDLARPEAATAGEVRPDRGSLMLGTSLGAVAVSTVLFGTACPAYGGPYRYDAPPTDAPVVDAALPLDAPAMDAAPAVDAPSAPDAPADEDAPSDPDAPADPDAP